MGRLSPRAASGGPRHEERCPRMCTKGPAGRFQQMPQVACWRWFTILQRASYTGANGTRKAGVKSRYRGAPAPPGTLAVFACLLAVSACIHEERAAPSRRIVVSQVGFLPSAGLGTPCKKVHRGGLLITMEVPELPAGCGAAAVRSRPLRFLHWCAFPCAVLLSIRPNGLRPNGIHHVGLHHVGNFP